MNIVQKPPLAGAARAPKNSRRVEVDLASTKPGTPGGVFLRQFWICVHRSEDLPPVAPNPSAS